LLLPDTLIAATEVIAGLLLLTRNVRHFQGIPALMLASP
jgi:predicted nucleic acid-binding protein